MKPILLVLLLCFALPAFSEVEPNNSRFLANRMVAGASVTGQLSSTADADWYVVNVPGGSEFILEMRQIIPEYLEGKWRVAIYNDSGTLLSRFDSWLSSTERRTVEISQPGDYYIVVASDVIFYSSSEYSISVQTTSTIPTGSFSGVWETSIGHYISAHQKGSEVILALLGNTDFQGWEALSGFVTSPQTEVTVETIYGYVSLTVRLELTSETTLKITQLACTPLVSGYECEYQNGSVFTATKIF